MTTPSITPRTATVPIYQGDDMERLADLRHRAEIATRREQGLVANMGDDDTPADEAREAYNAAVAEAAERAVLVRVNQVGRKIFRRLLSEHPPREDHDVDQVLGYNDDTFGEALLMASVTEPAFGTVEAKQAFLDNLADGDFEQLMETAVALNRGRSADPLASRYSPTTPSTDATSSSLARLD